MNTLATGLLQTVILSSKATSVVSNIGTDLIIGTITTTTSSIGNMIKYLAISTQPGVSDLLDLISSLDFEFTMSIIEQLVREQEGKQINESVKKALIGVSEILDLIHSELSSVKKAIEYHNTKYFNGWRSFSWEGNIETIKKHNFILSHRYKMLFDLLKIYNNPQYTN